MLKGDENNKKEVEEWEVEEILASKIINGKLSYQVLQKGWDLNPEQWLVENFKNAIQKLREFYDKNPNALGPPKRLVIWERVV